jgi:hypothetical protein
MAASIAFDATQKSGATVTAGNTYTLALTVASAAGADRLVFLAAVSNIVSVSDFSAVTIDGQSATRVGSAVWGAAGDPSFVTAYRAAGTANTSINVVATVGGNSMFSCYAACYKLTNVGTLFASATSAAINPTLSLNTISGGVAGAAVTCYNTGGAGASTWTGLTKRHDGVQMFGNDLFTGASLDIVSGSSPLTVTQAVTTSGPASTSSAGLALSFRAAAVVPQTMHHYRMRRA